jgi:hypothetical protein
MAEDVHVASGFAHYFRVGRECVLANAEWVIVHHLNHYNSARRTSKVTA